MIVSDAGNTIDLVFDLLLLLALVLVPLALFLDWLEGLTR